MTNVAEEYGELDAITARLSKIDKERDKLRERAAQLVVSLLEAKELPSEVANRSPFSGGHVRTLARVAGIPPAKRGAKKAQASS